MSAPRIIFALIAALVIGVTPALAAAISVDAPGDITLFALGVVGLFVGRQISKRRKKSDSEEAG